MSEECWSCYYFGQCGDDSPCEYYDSVEDDGRTDRLIESEREAYRHAFFTYISGWDD